MLVYFYADLSKLCLMTYLRAHEEYEDRYDHITVEHGRSEIKWFMQAHDELFKKYKGKNIPKNLDFWWDRLCFWLVELPLGERWEKKNETIEKWREEDKAKDDRLENARLFFEPVCCHCGKTGLRITSKHFMNRTKDYDNPRDEQVLLILRCTHCKLATTYWEDGEQYEVAPTLCPRCDSNMAEKVTNRGRVITSLYTCPACGHSYSTKLDLSSEREEVDKDYERDKAIYCVSDKRGQELTLYRTTQWPLFKQAYDEFQEKESNKDLFDAIEKLEMLKVAEIIEKLKPLIEKAGYIEVRFDKPEIGREFTVGFSCLDGKSDREDYTSTTTLKKVIRTALKQSNWRLMSDGINYRLGYLSGRLRAYERKEDIKNLVMKAQKLKNK